MQQVCPLLPVSTSEIQSFLPFSALDFFGMMITVEQRMYFNAAGRIPQQVIFQVLACKGWSKSHRIVPNIISSILKRRHFILILRWGGEWFNTESSCGLRVINVFHVQLLRFNPADTDREKLKVIFPRSMVWCRNSSSRRTTRIHGRLRSANCALWPLVLVLHTIHLHQVVIGRQLGDARAKAALSDRVLATAYRLLVGGHRVTLGLLLSTVNIYGNARIEMVHFNYTYYLNAQTHYSHTMTSPALALTHMSENDTAYIRADKVIALMSNPEIYTAEKEFQLLWE